MTTENERAAWFLSYVRGRRVMMAGGGVALAAFGIIVIAVHHASANLNIGLGGVTLLGILLVIGSFNGRRVVREIVPALSGTSRTMELRTWGSRSPGSPVINRVLATLDDVGGRDRIPKIEFKAIWFTPGIAEGPGSDARVYGGEAEGRAVLALGDQGAVMGRVKTVRPS